MNKINLNRRLMVLAILIYSALSSNAMTYHNRSKFASFFAIYYLFGGREREREKNEFGKKNKKKTHAFHAGLYVHISLPLRALTL